MSDPYLVKPDQEFLQGVLAEGGEDLKKCFQCATCSMVCELSGNRKPFPRKEMIWTQWGLKDRLLADPDIWVCHQCNDCSTRCPRGARPGDVLAAVRKKAIEHYSVPGFLGSWLNQTSMLPVVLLVVPVVLLGLALALRGPIESIGPLQGILHYLGHPGFYADFVPHWMLIGLFSTLTGLAALAGLAGLAKFWMAMKAADEAAGGYKPVQGLVGSAIGALTAVFTHNKFSKCGENASRKLAHLTAFYGFLALFVVTVWAVIDLYLNPLLGIDAMYPFSLMHPMKMLANIGCVALIYGCVKAITDRMKGGDEVGASTTFDWIFVWLLLAVAVTGLFTEILRLVAEPKDIAALKPVAYAIYFAHLVCVFDLLVYLPYSKFAHILYRTVALIYSEHTGRDAVEVEKT